METLGPRVGHLRTSSPATSFSRMEDGPGQSTTNATMKRMANLEASPKGVGCLTVVDDPGTSSASGGISSLEQHQQLLVVPRRWTYLNHLNSCWYLIIKMVL